MVDQNKQVMATYQFSNAELIDLRLAIQLRMNEAVANNVKETYDKYCKIEQTINAILAARNTRG